MNRKILICLIALVCSQFILFTLNAVEAAKTVDTTKTTEAVKVTEVAVTKTKDDKVAKPVVETDKKKLEQFNQFVKDAAADKAWAMFNVGKCYSVGDGVNKDLVKAVEWY